MKDLFSNHAAEYARFRPSYPPALYELILQYLGSKERAWDCATGNGQAAIDLATYFTEVVATDMSANQLSQAIARDNVTYLQCPAEKTPFPDQHFDLITVAQAYHWFDHTRFQEEVLRVAKPGCIIAIWGYGLIENPDSSISKLIGGLYRDILGSYWDDERKHVDNHYRSLSFPFQKLLTADLKMTKTYTQHHFIKYLETWSAVQKYLVANRVNPLESFERELSGLWKTTPTLDFHFPLFLFIGKVSN